MHANWWGEASRGPSAALYLTGLIQESRARRVGLGGWDRTVATHHGPRLKPSRQHRWAQVGQTKKGDRVPGDIHPRCLNVKTHENTGTQFLSSHSVTHLPNTYYAPGPTLGTGNNELSKALTPSRAEG